MLGWYECIERCNLTAGRGMMIACMHFQGTEVHKRLNSYAKIHSLGIAGLTDSGSKLQSLKLSWFLSSFQDSRSAYSFEDGIWFTYSIFRYGFWRPNHTFCQNQVKSALRVSLT